MATFTKHDVIPLGQLNGKVKQLDALKRVTFSCSVHEGKVLELYCDTCAELICLHCTVDKHNGPEHHYSLIGDTFDKYKTAITPSLERIESQVETVNKVVEQINQRSAEVCNQQEATKAEIQLSFQELYKQLEVRKTELLKQLDQLVDQKLKNLTIQKDEVEIIQLRLTRCLGFVKSSLTTENKVESVKMKSAITEQIKDVSENFNPEELRPCELPNVKFIALSEFIQNYQQFGGVYLSLASPKKCYATGNGLEIAKVGERATAVLHVINAEEKPCTISLETILCYLIHDSGAESSVSNQEAKCTVRKNVQDGEYRVSYQPTNRGRHQLHIKVEGEHIKGSPFLVTVKLPLKKLGTPIKTISSGLRMPRGIAVSQQGEIIVAEYGASCVSIISPAGEKLKSFGTHGSEAGQFSKPHAVFIDGNKNFLVVDEGNSSIQKFTQDGTFIQGRGSDFDRPLGIAIAPNHEKIVVAEFGSHRIQVLNPDFTFTAHIGSSGNGDDEFCSPYDVAFDNTGEKIYVTDSGNNRIQVLTMDGQFVQQFGKKGSNSEQINYPAGISIDNSNLVYVTERQNHCVSVFTCEGKFLTSFGSYGNGPGQFSSPRGITVDKNGVLYVSDTDNNRIQIF
jgi:tripartite motif-containing protein 2/3/tripartite motif-containing protein 71